MSEDVEEIDLTSTSELLSRTEYSWKCIAEGDYETALKSLEKVMNAYPRSISTLLERATIYVKHSDYDNACANLHEIFNIDSQNLPAVLLLYKIAKIQAQEFIDRQLYGAAAGCYMTLLKIPVLSENKKLGPIFLERLVRHVLSFYTGLGITDINNMYKEQDDQRLREGRDLAENDLWNVIEQRRLSRMSAVEVNTASSQMELYSDDTDVEEWTTRKISNDQRRESYSRKMKSPIEVNTVSSRRHFVSDDTDEEQQQLTRRRSKDRQRRSHSRKRSHPRRKRRHPYDTDEEWTAKGKSKRYRRESYSVEREATPGPSGIYHRESEEEWKAIRHHKSKHMHKESHSRKRNRESIPGPSRIIHCKSKEEWKVIHHKCKHMQKKITFSKRRYKHCRCCHCECHRDFSDSRCHHCYVSSSSSSDSSA